MQQRRRKYKSLNPRRRRRSKLLIIAVFVISAIALVAFNQMPKAHGVTEGLFSFTPGESPEKALEFLNSEAEANVWDNVLDTMPGDGCVRMHINGLGGPLSRVFNDSNHTHYAEAEPMGIKPIKCDADLADIHVPLVRIRSCQNFYVYELKHSFPYLIPEAAKRLDEVGQRFNDSLRARGGGDYRLKVTSMLRTDGSVRRLRRVNRVAVDSSVHRFGTTFDISYTRFMLNRFGGTYRTQEDLKNLLAEVLFAMRNEGKIYVKYERSTGCFHITARRNGSATS